MNAKISIFAIFACFALLFASCDNDDNKDVPGIQPPKLISDSFKTKYPDAKDTDWKVAGNYYVADFRTDSTEITAWFAQTSGQWLMDKSDLRVTLIPDDIIDTIQEGNFALWTIDDAYIINRDGFGSVYKVEVQQGSQDFDLYFSEYGNLIKKSEDAQNDADEPILIPSQVASLLEMTFQESVLLDIISNDSGYQLFMLDNTLFQIVQLNNNYIWTSTTWQLTKQEVPSLIMQAFGASVYGNDVIRSIYKLSDTNGTFYQFNVVHNGTSTVVEFDVLGNIVK